MLKNDIEIKKYQGRFHIYQHLSGFVYTSHNMLPSYFVKPIYWPNSYSTKEECENLVKNFSMSLPFLSDYNLRFEDYDQMLSAVK